MDKTYLQYIKQLQYLLLNIDKLNYLPFFLTEF